MATRPEARTSSTPGGLFPNSRKIPPRPPDRGGFLPQFGQIQILPVGTRGGVPNPPPALFDVKTPIIPANNAEAQRLTKLAHKAGNVAAGRAKLQVSVRPGLSALGYTRAGLKRVDSRGKLLERGSLTAQVVRSKERSKGIFAQHITAPKDARERLAAARQKREIVGARGAAGTRRDTTGTGLDEQRRKGAEALIARLRSFGSAMPTTVAPGDSGQAGQSTPVVVGGEAVVTTGAYQPRNEGLERLLFLGGAVVIGFLALRRA